MVPETLVHVIDDDAAVRESMEFLLRSARMEVRTYESATSFLQALPHIAPGCIVTDVRMPDVSGIDLLRRLRDLELGMPVIVVTGHGDVPLAVEAMKVGAVDFLEKPFDDELLITSVKAALGRWQERSLRDHEQIELRRRLDTLSSRERDVLDGLLLGHPNKTIAYNLGISARTVEIYRANVMTKMQATSLSELVRMALLAGLLAPGAVK